MVDQAFDVFISYSRMDSGHAAALDTHLRAHGLRTFFDRRELAPGLRWIPALEKAINEAKAVIVLIGPKGLGNTQQYERELALIKQGKDSSFPVVPVILPGTDDPPAGFLHLLTWVDFGGFQNVYEAPGQLENLVRIVQGGALNDNSVREAICPYRGLDAFREEDSAFFFGRGQVDDPDSPLGSLCKKIQESTFVAVVGRSGSGKSSLVFAGLMPVLRRDHGQFWIIMSFRPGPEPLRALAEAFNLPRGDEGKAEYAERITREVQALRTGNPDILTQVVRQQISTAEGRPDCLLLFIDQWEEIYAQAPQAEEKEKYQQHKEDTQKFVELLLNLASSQKAKIVITVRADFYGQLIRHNGIGSILPKSQVNIGAIPRNELKRIIAEPAAKLGLFFEPSNLVEEILDDTGTDEGMLPLLQHALKEVWARREGNKLTANAYEEAGGVRRAIRITAEKAFDNLSNEDKEIAKRLFLRVISPGEGHEDTRARAAMPSGSKERKIVEYFAGPRTRLLIAGSDRASRATVEVTHEALIRTWPRLREWVDGNREKLRARLAVLQSQSDWEKNGFREDLLLPSGFQLERARELLLEPGDVAVEDIQDYINASLYREQCRIEAEEKRKLREAKIAAETALRYARKIRKISYFLAVALVFAVVAAGVAAWQVGAANLARQDADRQRDIAISSAETLVTAVTNRLGSIAGFASWKAVEVLKDAQKIFENLSSVGIDDTRLLISRAAALNEFARAYFTMSDPDNARSSLKEAQALIEEVEKISRDAQGSGNRLGSFEISGDMSRSDYKFDEAVAQYRKALAEDPESADARIRLLRKIAEAFMRKSDDSHRNEQISILSDAKKVLSEAQDQIAAAGGEDRSLINEIAIIKDLEGDVERRFGNIEAAERLYVSALSDFRSLVSKEPYDDELSLATGEVLVKLGDIHRHAGRGSEAAQSYRSAQLYISRVLYTNPGHMTGQLSKELLDHGIWALRNSINGVTGNVPKIGEGIDTKYFDGVGPFKFGMSPQQVSAIISTSTDTISFSDLKLAAEYRPGEVRYLWRWIKDLPDFVEFHKNISCLVQNGYVTFLFHEERLFEISVRFMSGNECEPRQKLLIEFARLHTIPIIETPSERRFRFEGERVTVGGKTTSYAVFIDFVAR